MAIGSPTVRATVNEKATTNPWVFSPEAQVDVDEYAVLIIGIDNIGGQGGVDARSSRMFVTDSAGNYWQRWDEYTNEGPSGGGASVAVWTCRVKHMLTTSDTITARFIVGRPLNAKGGILLAGSIGAGKRLVAETTINAFSGENSDPASSALSSLTSREHLYLRAIASIGTDAVVLTPTSGYTAVGGNGSGSGTTGGSVASNKRSLAEWKIETSTGSTSDPATDDDRVHANLFMALYEADDWAGAYTIGLGAPAASQTDAVPGLPSGWDIDDIALLLVESAASQPASAPTGYTEFTGSPQQASGGTLSFFWRRLQSGDGDPTVADTGDHTDAIILGIRGCPTTGDPFDLVVGGTEAADTSLSATGGTVNVDDALVVVVSVHDLDNAEVIHQSWANASLAYLDERWDAGTALGSGGGIGIAIGEMAAAGTLDATTATTSSTSHAFATIAFELAADSPVVISAAPAAVSASAQPATLNLGGAAVTATPAAATTAAQASSPVPAAATVQASPSVASAGAQAASPVQGALSIEASPAAISAAAQAAEPQTPVIVQAVPAAAAVAAQAASLALGASAVEATPAPISASAQALAVVPAALAVEATPAPVTPSAQAADPVPGALSLEGAPATTTTAAQAALPRAAVAVTAAPATALAAAQTSFPIVAGEPVVISAAPATTTASAQAATVERAPAAVQAAPAQVSVAPQFVTVSLEALMVSAQVAGLNVLAALGVPTSGVPGVPVGAGRGVRGSRMNSVRGSSSNSVRGSSTNSVRGANPNSLRGAKSNSVRGDE